MKNYKQFYFIIFLLNIIIIVSFVFLNSMSERFITHNKSLVYSITHIKSLITQSHLWTEEYINGDTKEYKKILDNEKTIKKELSILIHGGQIRNLYFNASHNPPYVKEEFLKLEVLLKEFLRSIHTRIQKEETQNPTTDISFDKNFFTITKTIDAIDSFINKRFTMMYQRYNYIKYTIFLTIFLLIILAGYLFYKLNARITYDMDVIEEQANELQRMNIFLEQQVKEETEKNISQEKKLLQQNKLLQMHELVNNLGHHWRQPLNAISLIASSTKLETEMNLINNQKLTESMDTIIEKTELLSETIDLFASTIKDDSINFSTINLNTFITKLQLLAHDNLAHKGITLKVSLDKELSTLITEENKLIMILLSLISNSENAFSKQKIDNKQIALTISNKNDSVVFTIIDNAGGVKKELLERIFEPYFTTEHQSQNKGLSLFTIYETVTNHLDGTILAENENGGLKYSIQLPKEVK